MRFLFLGCKVVRNVSKVDDSKGASTEAGDEADNNEPSSQNTPPVKEAAQTSPEPGDILGTRPNVATEFDCMCYFLYVSRH
jgi:hypothetical protein